MTVEGTLAATTRRRRIRVTGVVQGVGFRPFVHNLAARLGVSGFVGNDPDGVFIEVEAAPDTLDAFERSLAAEAPPWRSSKTSPPRRSLPPVKPGFGSSNRREGVDGPSCRPTSGPVTTVSPS